MEAAPHQGNGDESAVEQLMPLVQEELPRLAHQQMRREGPGHILQTSALIDEAYLRLVEQPQIRWENRAHFFGIAARLMRRILVDDARKRNSAKRGGSLIQVRLDEATSVVQGRRRTWLHWMMRCRHWRQSICVRVRLSS
jgi:RNA polymerase sigma factor (TIGR02999 family)